MGYIYKITNKINGKTYIGQTRTSIEQRWKEHIRAALRHDNKDHSAPLHLAIEKYGVDNFLVEQLDECENNDLDDYEIYWIKKLNSYNNGYNASLGGSGHTKYNYDEIVNYYLTHNYSIKDTCQFFNIYDQIVYSALKSKKINYKQLGQKTGFSKSNHPQKILLIEKNIIFQKISDIDKYFNKKVHPNIRRCLNGVTEKAYGYHWRILKDDEEIEGGTIYK